MTKKSNALVAALSFAAVSAASAGAYAADVNLNPGADWVSAINHAQPGDRILMHAGTYQGGGWIGPVHGTASAPITVLSADGPHTAIISGGSAEALRIGDGSSYLVFDGFEVRNSGSDVVHADGHCSYLTFRNIYAHDAGFNGDVFKINQCDHIIVEGCEGARPGPYANPDGNPYQQCLDFVDVDNSDVRDNYFHDAGSQIFFVKGDSTNTVVERNVFANAAAGASDPCVGIGGVTDLPLLNGQAYEAQQITFRNNLIYSCPVGGIAVYDTNGGYIANNLLLNNGGVEIQFRAGNGPAGGSTHIRAVNNIFVDTRGQMPTPYAILNHTLSDFTTSNNMFWNNGNPIPTSSVLNVSAQPGNLVANPMIASVPSLTATRAAMITAMKPSTSSQAARTAMDASGSPYNVLDDILANPRNGALDRGPYLLSSSSGGGTPPPSDGGTSSDASAPDAGSGGSVVTSVSFTANPTAGVVGQATTIRATSAGSTAPQYHYWVVTPTGAWTQPCGGYTANTTCAFTPTTAGTWQIAVSARDVNSTATYDATTNEQNYAVTATAPDAGTPDAGTPDASAPDAGGGTHVTSVSFTASPTAGVVNQATTITATSVGSSAPRYHYWVVTPSGAWTQPCGGYTASTTCTFTPNVTGTWKIAVSARDVNSTAQYEATTAETNYTVAATPPAGGTHVTSVSFTANPTMGAVGQPTTITATSAGSSAPQYHYWVVTPSGSWTQPCGGYTASTTCTFTPNVTGTWKIAVSARDVSSTAQYEATTAETSYTVNATSYADTMNGDAGVSDDGGTSGSSDEPAGGAGCSVGPHGGAGSNGLLGSLSLLGLAFGVGRLRRRKQAA